MTTDGDSRHDFSWFAHPARERGRRAVLGVVLILAFAALAANLMQSIWWAIFAAAILVVATNRFFFRSRFTIDDEGITAAYPLGRRHLRWADLRRFAHDPNGAFLSTRAKRSWLDASRGVHVLYGKNRDSVMEHIRAHLPEGGGKWAHWRSKLKHAFAVDPSGAQEPTPEQQEPVDWFCKQVAKRHLTTPGLIALEMSRPLNFISSQVMHFFAPGVWAIARPETHEKYNHLAEFLEHRGSFEYIARRIEHFEQEFMRQEKEKRSADSGDMADTQGGP